MKLTDEALGAVEFGRFRLLPHRRELRADGVAVELGSRAFDVLMVLTEARGALVTKDEIMARVWPDTVVEENKWLSRSRRYARRSEKIATSFGQYLAGATGSSLRSVR